MTESVCKANGFLTTLLHKIPCGMTVTMTDCKPNADCDRIGLQANSFLTALPNKIPCGMTVTMTVCKANADCDRIGLQGFGFLTAPLHKIPFHVGSCRRDDGDRSRLQG